MGALDLTANELQDGGYSNSKMVCKLLCCFTLASLFARTKVQSHRYCNVTLSRPDISQENSEYIQKYNCS